MKQTVTSCVFVDSFRACGRESQFSVPARRALFEYLEEYEDFCGTEFELDPVGICCEWSEHSSAREAAEEYGFEPEEDDDDDAREKSALEWLQGQTQVVEFDGGIVIQQF